MPDRDDPAHNQNRNRKGKMKTHKMKLALCATIAAIALSGCMNMPGIAKALSKDPAFVTVKVTTIYGSGLLVRDGRPENGNSISQEGSIQSIQPVPVQVVEKPSTNSPAAKAK